MLYISNLGNLRGRDLVKEGGGELISKAIADGFCAHINLWKLPKSLAVGVDYPLEEIPFSFISENKQKLLCRAMNIEALKWMLENGIHCYWREVDDFTVSSRGFILSFSPAVIPGSIVMNPESCLSEDLSNKDLVGICSDFILGYAL